MFLDSETNRVQVIRFLDRLSRRRVTIVDTPGFDDSGEDVSDTDTLRMITNFLLDECVYISNFRPLFLLLMVTFKIWEEEIRKSLATKKATAATLSKQQQALMQVQLEKEAKTRRHVQDIWANLTRGLHLVRSVVRAGVDEFHSYMTSVLFLLLNGALSRGSFLVGSIAFETYLVSSFLKAFY